MIKTNLCIRCLAMVFLFAACSKPGNIIPKKEFTMLLADVHLAGALLEARVVARDSTIFFDSAIYYQQVFNKHSCTRADFDSTMHYYTSQLGQFEKIYGRVLAYLNELNEAVFSISAQDSVMVNKHSLVITSNNDKQARFNIPVTKPGKYTLNAFGTVKYLKSAKKPVCELKLWRFDGTAKGKVLQTALFKYSPGDTIFSIEEEINVPDTGIFLIRANLLNYGKSLFSRNAQVMVKVDSLKAAYHLFNILLIIRLQIFVLVLNYYIRGLIKT
ncbi:MAG: DUF4296 domain-containing protein [Bacteroidales bacterium]|nr:DUF4296 domain-containing protein [Bacteroidales bacterium]